MNIYYFNITVLRNRNVFGEVVKTLDDARAEKISRLRVTADKLRSAGAGILINFIKEKYNIAGDVKVDKFGKPYFEDTDIHFNISHSGCYVIAAVSDEDIGIDIQKIKSDKHRIAEKNFLPSECAYINEIEDEKINQQRFCEIWAIKELANQEQSFYFSMSITINVIKTTTYSTTNFNDLSPALPDTTAK